MSPSCGRGSSAKPWPLLMNTEEPVLDEAAQDFVFGIGHLRRFQFILLDEVATFLEGQLACSALYTHAWLLENRQEQ